jgi:periplasmic divalent cation tolerance protein
MQSLVVLVTTASEEEAARIGQALVEEKLAACVNILGNVRSIFTWEGEVQSEAEALMVVKTGEHLFEALADRVRELHSYAVPEVIALPIRLGLREYLKWMKEVTRP